MWVETGVGMGRQVHRLSAKEVEKKRVPGYWCDGGGLYLQVSPSGTKSWIFRFSREGRAREMGLGSGLNVSLAEARAKAGDCRRLLADGIDPIEARAERSQKERLERVGTLTFSKCAARYIEANRAGWRNDKHASQWTNTLETYAGPVFGSLAVKNIDTSLVLRVLEPIWTKKPETANRVRGRMERVLDWARVMGYRNGENPARWRGHLDKLLPSALNRKTRKHHAALPYDELSAFLQSLRMQDSMTARALEFLILNVSRTGDVIGARADEVDLDKAVWTIPAARMKSGREHRVPLSTRAVEIAKAQPREGYLFPGMREGEPLSNMALLELLRRMGRGDLTVHGFRSTFKDWASECTSYANEVSEMALAHAVSGKVEAAYRRGDLFEKRRALMREWEKFCVSESVARVLPLNRRIA